MSQDDVLGCDDTQRIIEMVLEMEMEVEVEWVESGEA